MPQAAAVLTRSTLGEQLVTRHLMAAECTSDAWPAHVTALQACCAHHHACDQRMDAAVAEAPAAGVCIRCMSYACRMHGEYAARLP